MATRFSISAPRDYVLRRDACSYGYFVLLPNHWEPGTQTLSRVLDLSEGPSRVHVTQGGGRGKALAVLCDRGLSRAERGEATAQLTRMLRTDEPAETIAGFHRLDPRWKRLGRGRLFRSPTLFEDVIKTVTSCNVTWPSTVSMNRRLCEVLGRKAAGGGYSFPTAAKVARTRPSLLRARCGVGYRDARIVELARMFVRREIDPQWMHDPATSDEALREFLLTLPGIGPYAAANIMQLVGRYTHLPLDTESIRHGKTVLGFKGTDRAIMKRVDRHFAPFGEHRFRSYWFEMWHHYEAKHGMSWTWQREKTATAFTAAKLNKK